MSERTERTLQRVREQWDPEFELAENRFIPWTHLGQPLNRCKLGFISTAGVYLKDGFHQPFDHGHPHGDPGFREMPSNVDLNDLLIGHAHYDHRHALEDMNVVYPLERLHEMVRLGVIGQVAPLVYSFSGYITRPARLLSDSVPNVLQRLRRMQVDAVLLAAVSPVCHQSAGLIARTLEAAGIPTLVAGVYPDFWALVKPARGVWCKFPEGATFGPPGNVGKQQAVLQEMLGQFEEIQTPGAIIPLPYQWGSE